MSTILERYKKQREMTYQDVADEIERVTGKRYHPKYLNDVGRGLIPLSDGLKFKLLRTFPDIFLEEAVGEADPVMN